MVGNDASDRNEALADCRQHLSAEEFETRYRAGRARVLAEGDTQHAIALAAASLVDPD